MILHRELPPEPESIAEARRLIADVLFGLSPELLGDIKLMASELATNSVLHARSPFELTVFRGQGQIRVEVADQGVDLPHVQNPSPTDLCGRGIRIVQTLSSEWGVAQRPDGPGKVTWFTIDESLPF